MDLSLSIGIEIKSMLVRYLANQNIYIFTAAGVVPCGSRLKMSPRTSS